MIRCELTTNCLVGSVSIQGNCGESLITTANTNHLIDQHGDESNGKQLTEQLECIDEIWGPDLIPSQLTLDSSGFMTIPVLTGTIEAEIYEFNSMAPNDSGLINQHHYHHHHNTLTPSPVSHLHHHHHHQPNQQQQQLQSTCESNQGNTTIEASNFYGNHCHLTTTGF